MIDNAQGHARTNLSHPQELTNLLQTQELSCPGSVESIHDCRIQLNIHKASCVPDY